MAVRVNKAIIALSLDPGMRSSHTLVKSINNEEAKAVAYKFIDNAQLVGRSVYGGRAANTTSATESQAVLVKHALKCFIDFDRGIIEQLQCSPDPNSREAQRAFVNEVIDWRGDLLKLYYIYKRDLLQASMRFPILLSISHDDPQARGATRTPSALGSASQFRLTAQRPQRDHKAKEDVAQRDRQRCKITGMHSRTFWSLPENRTREDHPLNLSAPHELQTKPCEVAHIIPWNPGTPYWELVKRLTGICALTDVPQNALLLEHDMHDFLGRFDIWIDFERHLHSREGYQLRNVFSQRDNVLRAADLNGAALLPGDGSTEEPEFFYFALHKLIGDVVYMVGAAEVLDLPYDSEDDLMELNPHSAWILTDKLEELLSSEGYLEGHTPDNEVGIENEFHPNHVLVL